MKKKLGCLAVVLGVFVLICSCYLVCFSPDSGYYQIKFGMARGAPFRMHGKVVDQYGNGVPWFEVKVIPLFSADTRRWDKGPVVLVTRQSDQGKRDGSGISGAEK